MSSFRLTLVPPKMMSDADHAHVPHLVIIIKELNKVLLPIPSYIFPLIVIFNSQLVHLHPHIRFVSDV